MATAARVAGMAPKALAEHRAHNDSSERLPAGVPAPRRVFKISRKRKMSHLALRRLMRPVSVHCGVKPISASGKTTGRPRLLSDEQHAENLTAIVKRRNRTHVQQTRNAVKKLQTIRASLIQHVRQMCADLRWLAPAGDPEHRATPDLRNPHVREALRMFRSPELSNELLHRVKVLVLKMVECYHGLMRAREYAQKHRVTAAALAAQALQVRQNILPELVESRRLYFKRYEPYESDDDEAADNPVEDVAGRGGGVQAGGARVRRHSKRKRVQSHGDARQDSMEVMARTAVRRSGGNSLRNNAQCLKIRRRKEANIRTELKRTTSEGRRAQLNAELNEVLASGRLFRCKIARIARMRQRRKAQEAEQMRRGAYVHDTVKQQQQQRDSCRDTEAVRHAQHSLDPADQQRAQAEAEKKRAREKNLARIRARDFPERTAPDLHVVSKTCEMLCTSFDQLDCMLGAFANAMRMRADCTTYAVIILDLIRLGALDDWNALHAYLSNNLTKALVASVPLEETIMQTLDGMVTCMDDVYAFEDHVQQWYNHGEGGLKTAYCARNNVQSQTIARANVPPLGNMYQHTMFRGVHRIVNRDDETVPLPSSSFSASGAAVDGRGRGRA